MSDFVPRSLVVLALVALSACGGGGGGGGGGPQSYTIGGSITGLSGTVVLQNNGATLSRTTNGNFSFGTQVDAGSNYLVTVQTQPQDQTCTVVNGQGTANGTVSNIAVTCVTNQVTIGGSVAGLAGTLVLENNQLDSLAVRTTDPGHPAFTFPAIASGSTYSVTVLQQPPGQDCTVANGSNTAHGNVSNVAVTCVPNTVTLGGTVSGLTGAGLVLQSQLTENLPVTSAGGADVPFTFTSAIKSGNPYAVTIAAQPAGQTCTVTANGSGTANASISNVGVTCAAIPANVTVAASVDGLAGTLQLRVVHALNGATNNTDVPVTTNGNNVALASIQGGSGYTIGVLAQPAGQTCLVYNFAGVALADVSNIQVECSNGTTTYAVGGSATGLTSAGLLLVMDVGGFLQVAPNASGPAQFTFTRRLPPDTEFRVGIAQQPAGLTCVMPETTGEVDMSDVTNIAVTCVPNTTDPLNGIYVLPGRTGYLSFLPDGQYALASHENTPPPPDPDSCGASRGNGVELGVYRYNAATGALTIVANMIDTNGDCGLWADGPPDPITLQKSGIGQGSVLTATVGTDSYTLTPALSGSGLTGAFRLPFTPTFMVLDATRYVIGDFGRGSRGIESGCYTANGSTLTATVVTATCAGAVDTNGDAGLAGDGTGEPIPYQISQALLIVGTPPHEGVGMVRTIPN